MSLVQSAQNKDAIGFKQKFNEAVEAKVDAILAETKIEVASTLINEAGGIHDPKLPHISWRPKIKGKPTMPGKKVVEDTEVVDEKVITPGSVEHMAHAVHAAATGQHEPVSTRGTFQQFHTPHYHISKDHGGIDADKHEMHYYVAGSGGMHKFAVHHGSKGVDVKHLGKMS
jgi:hypothetical protein